MKVVILCGGKGTRFREETEHRPKPLVEVGGHPILWHIMKGYAAQGLDDFVLCLGYKGEMIKRYFMDYRWLNSDLAIELGTQKVSLLDSHMDTTWRVSLIDTGQETMTGARLKKVERYVHGDTFMVTYGDGVTDLNINDLLRFHQSHGKIGTVTGVSPPSRYGELGIEHDRVVSFREKPQSSQANISGGYFVFKRAFFDYLSADESCVLEREPLENLALAGELKVYRHNGFWQCMDTARDYEYLQRLWGEGRAPWRTWAD
ncbi:MAG: glucose-1-phosphate cytidylyltransferase [SAR202 cluster bacterium]|nr:glucose-1-phosphate cytidylyltransferase [SAR202 cluster bacterium]